MAARTVMMLAIQTQQLPPGLGRRAGGGPPGYPFDEGYERAESEAPTNEPCVDPPSDGSAGRRRHRRGKRGNYNQVNADPDEAVPGQAIETAHQANSGSDVSRNQVLLQQLLTG